MGELVQFSDYCRGCNTCANMRRVDSDTYLCTVMQWDDGTTVYPIENGKKTEGFNVCGGEEYIKQPKKGVKYGKRFDM